MGDEGGRVVGGKVKGAREREDDSGRVKARDSMRECSWGKSAGIWRGVRGG